MWGTIVVFGKAWGKEEHCFATLPSGGIFWITDWGRGGTTLAGLTFCLGGGGREEKKLWERGGIMQGPLGAAVGRGKDSAPSGSLIKTGPKKGDLQDLEKQKTRGNLGTGESQRLDYD